MYLASARVQYTTLDARSGPSSTGGGRVAKQLALRCPTTRSQIKSNDDVLENAGGTVGLDASLCRPALRGLGTLAFLGEIKAGHVFPGPRVSSGTLLARLTDSADPRPGTRG